MNQLIEKPSSNGIGLVKRKTVVSAKDDLVKNSFFGTGNRPPLVLQPVIEGVNPVSWLYTNREQVETQLRRHGAVLFRKFHLQDVDTFEEFIKTLGHELLTYSYQSTPRSAV